jgi:hypothetical protein
MPAYFIVDLEVTDPAWFDEYRQLVPDDSAIRGPLRGTGWGHRDPPKAIGSPNGWLSSNSQASTRPGAGTIPRNTVGPKALRFKTAKSKMILVEGA